MFRPAPNRVRAGHPDVSRAHLDLRLRPPLAGPWLCLAGPWLGWPVLCLAGTWLGWAWLCCIWSVGLLSCTLAELGSGCSFRRWGKMVPEDRVRAGGENKLKIKLFKSRTIPSGHNFNFSLSAESGAGGDPDPNIHEQCPKGVSRGPVRPRHSRVVRFGNPSVAQL